jgi:phytoene synthase
MLYSGWPLARDLPGRMGLEIRATIAGAAAILDRIEAARGDVFRYRPVLRGSDWVRILARALLKKGPPEASVS